MALPQPVRRLAPDRVRHSHRLRAVALRAGLIPPRTMHTEGEAALLRSLARGRRRVLEIGVYEGSSALVLVEALPLEAELHLVEPFGRGGPWPGVMNPASETAARAVVGRAARRRRGPRVFWHVALSEEAARDWSEPVDLVFVDGDHSKEGCRLDWELWSGWVETGGVIAFHDAREGRPGGWGVAGPTAVVDDLFRYGCTPGWEIAAERDTIVAVARLPAR
jgi:predicted O-methyltransferase YrrM